jgi:hypothetical protein
MANDNYLEKFNRTVEGLKFPPGSRTDVFVLHDDWCQFLKGGHCNCDPTLKIVCEGEKTH